MVLQIETNDTCRACEREATPYPDRAGSWYVRFAVGARAFLECFRFICGLPIPVGGSAKRYPRARFS